VPRSGGSDKAPGPQFPVFAQPEDELAEVSDKGDPQLETIFISSSADGALIPVPSILFEGDEPSAIPAMSRVRRIGAPMSGPRASVAVSETEPGAVQLHLTARDPRCLYADWNLPVEKQMQCNADSADQHLVLRLHEGKPTGPVLAEAKVHPESQHWFVHVDQPGVAYVAELGYATRQGNWRSLAISESTRTPAGGQSAPPMPVVFAQAVPTPPLPVVEMCSDQPPMALALEVIPGFEEGVFQAAPPIVQPLLPVLPVPPASVEAPHAFGWLLPSGNEPLTHAGASAWVPAPAPPWSPAQHQALTEVVSRASKKRVVGSGEIEELLSKRQAREAAPSSADVPMPGGPLSQSEGQGGEFPPSGQPPTPPSPAAPPGFWFQVNAELVVYGATEPDAVVTIGGRRIRLRPDGSFSYRFALPDGSYELPIQAVAVHGDSRSADLRFSRDTQYDGQVGKHPQDPDLRIPAPEHTQ
jgi:hypothetical protein